MIPPGPVLSTRLLSYAPVADKGSTRAGVLQAAVTQHLQEFPCRLRGNKKDLPQHCG